MTSRVVLLVAVLAALPAWPQSFLRNHFSAGLGAAVPGDDLKPVYSTAFAWNVGYGFRPWRYLQLDVALDGAYNAANVDEYYLGTGFGPLRIRDYQFFVPFGARGVLPLAKGRVEIYGGGGGAYLRYTEMLQQPCDYCDIVCPICRARDGWGYYAAVGGSVAVDKAQRFRIGVLTRVYRGHTDGRSVGLVPPIETKDKWVNTYGQFSFSF